MVDPSLRMDPETLVAGVSTESAGENIADVADFTEIGVSDAFVNRRRFAAGM
jgi:hypothetical protein